VYTTKFEPNGLKYGGRGGGGGEKAQDLDENGELYCAMIDLGE